MILPIQNLLLDVCPHPGHCLLQLQVHPLPSCTTSRDSKNMILEADGALLSKIPIL
jgi:hypothetical protein